MGTEDWREQASRCCCGRAGRLAGGSEEEPKKPQPQNTPIRPKELPGLDYPSRPEKKARSNRPALELPLVAFRLAKLTNWQRTRQGWLGAGPWALSLPRSQ